MTYKTAIVGCGGIFPMHAGSLAQIDNVCVQAVCDTDIKKAETRVSEFSALGLLKAYADFDEMLEKTEIDVLHICTPHYLHAPMTIKALKKGIHVLTEKPMATRVADAEQMIQTAEACDKRLGVIFQNRYNPAARYVKGLLTGTDVPKESALGHVISGRFSVQWHRTKPYYLESGWRGQWDTEGGGVIINQAIHTFDMANWFVGDEIADVDAQIANRKHPYIEVEDMAEGVIRYKNGAELTFYVHTNHFTDAPVEIELLCENGRVHIAGGDTARVTYPDGREVIVGKDPRDAALYGNGIKDYWGISHVKQIKAFYEALEVGDKTAAVFNAHEALKTQRIVEWIYAKR